MPKKYGIKSLKIQDIYLKSLNPIFFLKQKKKYTEFFLC